MRFLMPRPWNPDEKVTVVLLVVWFSSRSKVYWLYSWIWMILVWSRLRVYVCIVWLPGSTTVRSMIQDVEILPRNGLTHLGSRPVFMMSFVWWRRPSASMWRSMVSMESTCDAYGFGYRLKYASVAVSKVCGKVWELWK
ncbi:hypothetical protein KL919_001957 [Ogataea angusta]|nr:hypothetical protein KL919_001957 [Ogataea angusta]